MKLLDPGTHKIHAADEVTAKTIGDMLNRVYPGHLWAINCQWDQGILTIQNLMLPSRYGFLLKINREFSSSNLEARAKMAAGEILERYRLDRGRFDLDKWSELPEKVGNIIGDVT